MWLLRTATAELQYFNSPGDVKGGYAILSHVWQENEQSFQELQTLSTKLDARGGVLRACVSAKIRECCILAQSHGYEWLWIDTCCIDRTSSAELSEAINSMYNWYARAQVCYAFLYDVPPSRDLAGRDSAFRKSKWFTRGWTLQELIAPRCLLFVAQDWSVIGTKASMAPLLEDITGVGADVLTFRRDVGDVSVARRMWWASSRETTRLEDEAYCLMGIFGVHMATIYGEGTRAFQRLQEEILRRTSDQTLFAWGNVLPIRTAPFREQVSYTSYHHDSHIFAPCPAAFYHSGNMIPVPMERAVKNAMKALGITRWALLQGTQPANVPKSRDVTGNIPLPDFMVTSHGVRARLLVVESAARRFTLAIAVLSCRDTATGAFIGLLLRRRVDRETGLKWPRYHVGLTVHGQKQWLRLRYRLAQVDWARHALSFNTAGISARWQRLYISHRPPSRSPHPRARGEEEAFRFVFPRWLAVELAKEGFKPDAKLPTKRGEEQKLTGKGSIATFTFTHERLREDIRIHVGLCNNSPWATATWSGRELPVVPGTHPPASAALHRKWRSPRITTKLLTRHCCDRGYGPDSIRSWPNGSRIFGDAQRNVQLTFTRLNGGGSHLLDVKVGGSVYCTRTLRTLARCMSTVVLRR
ncbi:heterokaryon incompatibility protein-domain-containing protein [Trametes polyzona]|nr:heterokaryon incompatibility protein-domain-containing protein [Trametes polyzona]